MRGACNTCMICVKLPVYIGLSGFAGLQTHVASKEGGLTRVICIALEPLSPRSHAVPERVVRETVLSVARFGYVLQHHLARLGHEGSQPQEAHGATISPAILSHIYIYMCGGLSFSLSLSLCLSI